jgi:hydrogenase nickel incorporation protein HypA/HybF
VHELSLSSAIVDTVARHAEGRPVTRVNLRVGALRQVVPDVLAFYFEIVARDTLCEGATLAQELVPAVISCEECGHEWGLETPAFRCGRCGGAHTHVISGNEFEVESIHVEEAECIGQR